MPRKKLAKGELAVARHEDPDFVPSLRLLVEREEYSDTDIALMFGVSRERVRQWRNRHSIHHLTESQRFRGLYAVRIWDDSANRFRPVKKSFYRANDLARRQAQRRSEREEQTRRSREARRARLISVAIELKRTLGRDPTMREIASALSGRDVTKGAAMYCVARWDNTRRTTKERYRVFKAELSAATGIRFRDNRQRNGAAA